MSYFLIISYMLFGYIANADTILYDPIFKPPQISTSTNCPSNYGCLGYDNSQKKMIFHDGTSWLPIGTGGGGGGLGDVVGPAGSNANALPYFSDTTGKVLAASNRVQADDNNLYINNSGSLMLGITQANAVSPHFSIRFYGQTTSNYIDLKTPTSITGLYTLTLPNIGPQTDNRILQANSAGVLSWINTPVDTNTVTTVVDSVNSTSTTSALSANQGKLLNDDITALEATSHTHANKTVLDTLPSAVCTTVGDILKWTGSAFTCQADSSGTGDVVGQGTPFVNTIPKYSDTSGKLIQPSTIVIDSTNNIVAPATISAVGQIWSTMQANTGFETTINFNLGNNQHTNANCAAMTLQNMQDGGVYILVVKGTAVGTCTFSHAGITFYHYPPGHGPTVSGKQTLYSFVKMGVDLYIGWTPDL